jgi:hypothetical protein
MSTNFKAAIFSKLRKISYLVRLMYRSLQFYYLLFSLALQPSAGYGLLVFSRDFLIIHNNAPQLVGLLWTNDQLIAKTST